MNLSKSSNPVLADKVLSRSMEYADDSVMTISGTINKIFLLLLLVISSAAYSWSLYAGLIPNTGISLNGFMLATGLSGFVMAMITMFKPAWSMYTAPVYALLEGLFLGAISVMFDRMYPGLVMQAVCLTFATLFSLLFAYKSGIIVLNAKLRSVIVAATGGICVFYVFSFILGMFGMDMSFMHGSSLLSIGISLVVVVVAALNLILDFDFIEKGARQEAPKYIEWYAAFGLILTLVWLYLEFLKLLMKLADRD